ncbi:MAG: amidohydrolase family protein [Anaerolineae bacterium]
MPNLILHHGRLWTQDDRWPDATAVALQAGRILAVGSDAEVLALARPHTELIDLAGRRVLPGLTDAHFHFQGWALSRRELPLAGLISRPAVQAALGQAASQAQPGQWITGQGWNELDWPEPRLLTRHDLDAAAPRHPVVLWRSDLHLATANSLALQLAGIDAHTPDPVAGLIDREADGQPSGVLRDRAIDLVDAVLPQPGAVEIAAAMRDAMAEAHRLGLTGIHDFRIGDASESRGAFEVWQRLHAAGELRLRVWMMIGGELLDEAIRLGVRSGFGDDRLRIGAVKYFADGSLGARTAWMLEPYADGGLGLPVTSMAELASAIRRGAAAGLPVAIHAIGDRAVRELLDVFSEILPAVNAQLPMDNAQWTMAIDHRQFPHPPPDRARAAFPSSTTCAGWAVWGWWPRCSRSIRWTTWRWWSVLWAAALHQASMIARAGPMPGARCWTTARCWRWAPTVRWPRPTPSGASTPRSPVSAATARRPAAGILNSASAWPRPSRAIPWARPTPAGSWPRRAASALASWPIWWCWIAISWPRRPRRSPQSAPF